MDEWMDWCYIIYALHHQLSQIQKKLLTASGWFIRPVSAVIVHIAVPRFRDAVGVVTGKIVGWTLRTAAYHRKASYSLKVITVTKLIYISSRLLNNKQHSISLPPHWIGSSSIFSLLTFQSTVSETRSIALLYLTLPYIILSFVTLQHPTLPYPNAPYYTWF